MEVMEAKERLPKETKGKAKEKNQAWDEVQSAFNKEEVEEVDFLQPYLHLLSPSLIELLRFCETTRGRNTYLTREVVLLEKHITDLQGSPPLMVNGTTLTLEHVMRRLDIIENKVATIELIENLDKKIHNQITQYGSKVGMTLKNSKEREPTINEKLGHDSARIGKLEDVIINLGSTFAAVQNTPNCAHNKATKFVFLPKNSGEPSGKRDEDLKMISVHPTYGLSTKDDDT
ncbi:Far1 [Hordeum vulgare]|nr:Far1 [Hordeum vulgare]